MAKKKRAGMGTQDLTKTNLAVSVACWEEAAALARADTERTGYDIKPTAVLRKAVRHGLDQMQAEQKSRK